MLNDKLSYITLSGETYPIRCGMEVLEEIQDRYGSIDEFEKKIMIFEPQRDEDGNPVENEDGNVIGQYMTPRIKDLGDALHMMVTAGLEMEAEESEKPVKKVTRRELLEKADMTPVSLGLALHAELMRCFRTKNAVTTQTREKRTENL